MSNRLTLDANIIGYWGFDEALESDNAIDESQYADAHLTVTGSASVQLGRVGSARTLSGTAFGTVSNSRLRVIGDLTIFGWLKLATVNNAGSLLRCLLSCGGPTSGDAQNYAVYVDNAGRLVYKHTSASGEVIVRSAAGRIRVNQYYHVTIIRQSNTVTFYIDNFAAATPDVTVNGVPSSFPVPAPIANGSAALFVGKSTKETDLAYWDGLVDEISVHDVARAYQPYVRDTYFRVALRSATMKLSGLNSVLSVSSSDMGAGVRWWCYERDKELYVVKESPFGMFGDEIRLTTPGTTSFTGTTLPELVYDPTSDTLLVLFVAGNRIYKLTANSTDAPATINMPFTSDVGSIIKLIDNLDGGRMGASSGGQREVILQDYSQTTTLPVKFFKVDDPDSLGGSGGGQQGLTTFGSPDTPSIAFLTHPTYGFGFTVGPVNTEMSGYLAYYMAGDVVVPAASPILIDPSLYFVPIGTRVYGRAYLVQALAPGLVPSGIFSDAIFDYFIEARLKPTGDWIIGRNSDASDGTTMGGSGGGAREVLPSEYTYVDRQPVKYSGQDSDTNYLGASGGGESGSVTQNSVTVNL